MTLSLNPSPFDKCNTHKKTRKVNFENRQSPSHIPGSGSKDSTENKKLNKDLLDSLTNEYNNEDNNEYTNEDTSIKNLHSNYNDLYNETSVNNIRNTIMNSIKKHNPNVDNSDESEIHGINNDNKSNYNENYKLNYNDLNYNNNHNNHNNHNNIIHNNNKLLDKIDYIIHLLEEQHNEKTSNITEELILYLFLGIFIIYVLDSFSRMSKYKR